MYLITLLVFLALYLYSFDLGFKATKSGTMQFITMLQIVPPIFLLIGLMDVWVPKETMMKIMGEKSGWVGFFIAFLFGTFAAGPLVAAFPVAYIMLKKGARYANVLFFLMIWASAKLPIIFFQATTMGWKFTIVSNITLIIIYLIGSITIEKLLGAKEKERITKLAEAY